MQFFPLNFIFIFQFNNFHFLQPYDRPIATAWCSMVAQGQPAEQFSTAESEEWISDIEEDDA